MAEPAAQEPPTQFGGQTILSRKKNRKRKRANEGSNSDKMREGKNGRKGGELPEAGEAASYARLIFVR